MSKAENLKEALSVAVDQALDGHIKMKTFLNMMNVFLFEADIEHSLKQKLTSEFLEIDALYSDISAGEIQEQSSEVLTSYGNALREIRALLRNCGT